MSIKNQLNVNPKLNKNLGKQSLVQPLSDPTK